MPSTSISKDHILLLIIPSSKRISWFFNHPILFQNYLITYPLHQSLKQTWTLYIILFSNYTVMSQAEFNKTYPQIVSPTSDNKVRSLPPNKEKTHTATLKTCKAYSPRHFFNLFLLSSSIIWVFQLFHTESSSSSIILYQLFRAYQYNLIFSYNS